MCPTSWRRSRSVVPRPARGPRWFRAEGPVQTCFRWRRGCWRRFRGSSLSQEHRMCPWGSVCKCGLGFACCIFSFITVARASASRVLPHGGSSYSSPSPEPLVPGLGSPTPRWWRPLPFALIYFKSLFTPAVARPPHASPGPLPCAGSACCLRSTLELLPGTWSPDAEAVEEVVYQKPTSCLGGRDVK